ncbi:polysaccharide lyase family 1 protein [Uliginosibacterium paludis]|uniref:Polysaccharide lyase family 1 protein n=1 Tax=Uliginosibacterium paludis TaxID=1615952 RepID=A0ABV2CR24_9RHOO
MSATRNMSMVAAAAALSALAACGGGGGVASGGDPGGAWEPDVAPPISSSSSSSGSSDSNDSSSSSSQGNSSSSSSSSAPPNPSVPVPPGSMSCPALTLDIPDAAELTGASTPFQSARYGVRNYYAPGPGPEGGSKHPASNYEAAPKLPDWQFASIDPTQGELSGLECDVAPYNGWHSFARASGSTAADITHKPVTVTGGRNAAKENIYTVFNGQQLVAAINEAQNKPKIIRVVGHIDLRMSENNSKFEEYTGYYDQKFGGSIMIPSNTTLVGINDAQGRPARITGTTILIGSELSNGGSSAEDDFKKWIAAGKNGEDFPTWTRNIIIRNLAIDHPWDVNPEGTADAYADGMTLTRAQNVWIDHLTMSDGDTPYGSGTNASKTRHDGLLDIVRGSDYVTVTNTHLHSHGKTMLVGNGDSGRAWSDQDRLHVTLANNRWQGLQSRHPLTRFSQLHSFNNLVEGTTGSAAVGQKFENGLDVRYGASVFAENNFHLFSGLKTTEVCGKLIDGKDGVGFRTRGNYFISDKEAGKDWALAYNGPINVDSALQAANCAKATLPAADIAWEPPYQYQAVCAPQARRNAQMQAGAGRIGLAATTGTHDDGLSNDSCYEGNELGNTNGSASSSSSAASSSSSSSGSDSSASSSSSSSSSTGNSSSSSSSTGTVTLLSSWSDDFSSATSSSFVTAAYASILDASGNALPMYVRTGGSIAITEGVLTLTGTRFTAGALGNTTTSTASSGFLGAFDIAGRNCRFTMALTEAASGSGRFMILVDNNTTTGGSSPHGASAVVVNKLAADLAAGEHSFSWSLPVSQAVQGSFIQIRTESNTTIRMDRFDMHCG